MGDYFSAPPLRSRRLRGELFFTGKSLASGRVSLLAASVRLHGTRPWHLCKLGRFLCSGERETPRRKAVASGRVEGGGLWLAASVRLHGARPWHLGRVGGVRFGSRERETPRRKAVASGRVEGGALWLAASVRLHGARPWH